MGWESQPSIPKDKQKAGITEQYQPSKIAKGGAAFAPVAL